MSESPANLRRPQAKSPFKALIGIELGFIALAWIAFGVFAFLQVQAWGVEYDRKVAAVASGAIKPVTLRIAGIHEEKDSDGFRDGWIVALNDGAQTVAWRRVPDTDNIRVGNEIVAYPFGDDYLIPQFDRGGHHWGKWVFLAFGLLPAAPVVGCILLSRILRKRRCQLSIITPETPVNSLT